MMRTAFGALAPILAPILALAPALALVAAAPAGARAISGTLIGPKEVLPAGTLLLVEARSPDGRRLGQATMPLGADQGLPLPYALQVSGDPPLRLRAGLFVAGREALASAEVPVAAGSGDTALPPIPLDRFAALSFASRFRCGDTRVNVVFAQDGAKLMIGAKEADLMPERSTSGSRYGLAGDPGTWVLQQPSGVTVSLNGNALPACLPELAPLLFPFHAHGAAPDWRLDIADATMTLELEGAAPSSLPLPDPVQRLDGMHFTVTDGPKIALSLGLCHDSAGLAYPVTVSLATAGGTLAGCGGDPARLIEGPAWQVTAIAGVALDPNLAESLRFVAGRLSGQTACNAFAGPYRLDDSGLKIGPLTVGQQSCALAPTAEQARLLAALAAATRFDIGADGGLQLYAGNRELLAAKR